MHGSGLSGASLLPTPPPDDQFPEAFRHMGGGGDAAGSTIPRPPSSSSSSQPQKGFTVEAWMELWDYAGGASFRAFVVSNGDETSLFVFFDTQGVMGRDLKKA